MARLARAGARAANLGCPRPAAAATPRFTGRPQRVIRPNLRVRAGWATPGFDANLDADKFSNTNGLNLASIIQGGQQLATNALPPSVFLAPYTVDSFVGIPQDDQYTLAVGQLDNFGLLVVYLVDAQAQTRRLLALGSTHSLPLNGANTGNTCITTRFSLVFEPITGPLPATLVAFTAQIQGPDGLLQWPTASEVRNDHFKAESSLDGTAFAALG